MGIEAEVFGTPGQERFEFIFKIFAREVSGILLVVDASRPEDFDRAKHMPDLVGPRIPFVVLANKSDLPGALPPAEIARGMALPADTPVVPTVATENHGVKDAILNPPARFARKGGPPADVPPELQGILAELR